MSSTAESLLAAILEDPHGDGPRVRYAEFCVEHGDPDRSEMIHLGLDVVARMRAGREDWSQPWTRARDLAKRHPEWSAPIAAKVNALEFGRGFVERVKLKAADFLARADALVAMAPIRRLILTEARDVGDALFASPHLDRIVSLAFDGYPGIDDRTVALLADSNHLFNLAYLDLGGGQVTLAGLESLAASTKLPKLSVVELAGSPARVAAEIVTEDQGAVLGFGRGSDAARSIEAKFGRKTWLHAVEDHGWRRVWEPEF